MESQSVISTGYLWTKETLLALRVGANSPNTFNIMWPNQTRPKNVRQLPRRRCSWGPKRSKLLSAPNHTYVVRLGLSMGGGASEPGVVGQVAQLQVADDGGPA
jgi:hypothetical protein